MQILYSREAEATNRRLLDADRQLLARGRELLAAGQMAQSDVAQLEAQVSSGEYDVVNSATQIAQYELQLKQLLKLPGDEDLHIGTAEVPADEAVLAPIPLTAEVYQAALSQRPEIESSTLSVEQSDLAVKIAKAGRMPTVSLTAGLGDSHMTGTRSDYFTQMKNNFDGSLGISLSIPIFDGRSTKSAVERAQIGQLTARLDQQETRKQLYSTIETCHQNLFTGGEDPVGRVIRFGTIPLRITGVLEAKGYNSAGMDQDDLVLAPYTTVMKRVLAVDYLQGINCSAITEDMTDLAIEDISALLRNSHKLRETDEDDFTIRSQQEMAEMMNTTSDLMSTLLLCVACISLVVGGIGIMNIMYVSVTERTREIGLRMSVGARGIDILSQFLIEAVLLSFAGGLIGILVGIGATVAIKQLAHWPVYIQPWSVVLSFAVCTATGVFFGWYPAKKAAQLDPIEAIRYE